jgi:hypothetical protein
MKPLAGMPANMGNHSFYLHLLVNESIRIFNNLIYRDYGRCR